MALSRSWLEFQLARNIVRASVLHVAKNRGRPDKDVCVPDGRHTVILVRLDSNEDAVVLVHILDGLHALGFGEREERALHRVLLVAELEIDDGWQEEVKRGIVKA